LEDAAILVDIGHVVERGAVPVMMELHVSLQPPPRGHTPHRTYTLCSAVYLGATLLGTPRRTTCNGLMPSSRRPMTSLTYASDWVRVWALAVGAPDVIMPRIALRG
jgi:hypothetical protein